MPEQRNISGVLISVQRHRQRAALPLCKGEQNVEALHWSAGLVLQAKREKSGEKRLRGGWAGTEVSQKIKLRAGADGSLWRNSQWISDDAWQQAQAYQNLRTSLVSPVLITLQDIIILIREHQIGVVVVLVFFNLNL